MWSERTFFPLFFCRYLIPAALALAAFAFAKDTFSSDGNEAQMETLTDLPDDFVIVIGKFITPWAGESDGEKIITRWWACTHPGPIREVLRAEIKESANAARERRRYYEEHGGFGFEEPLCGQREGGVFGVWRVIEIYNDLPDRGVPRTYSLVHILVVNLCEDGLFSFKWYYGYTSNPVMDEEQYLEYLQRGGRGRNA